MSSAKQWPFCLGLNVLKMLFAKWQLFCLNLNLLNTSYNLHPLYLIYKLHVIAHTYVLYLSLNFD